MGKVIDPNIAFSYCHGYKINEELILWSPGVIGTLSDAQEKLCKEIKIHSKAPERLMRRIKLFREAVKACEGLPLTKFLPCVGVELRKRGIEI